MKELLFTLLLLAIWMVPKFVKASKVEKQKQNDMQQYQKKSTRTSKVPENNVDIEGCERQNLDVNVPKETEYFTYEADRESNPLFIRKLVRKEEVDSQNIENEKENIELLTLEEEEIYKGFIYSEILQKKVN